MKCKLLFSVPEWKIQQLLCSLAQTVKGMLAFAIFITHGLACYVAIDITWHDYMMKRFSTSNHKTFWEYVIRTCLVLVTCKLSFQIQFLTD